jgi:AMP-polyphosphate phosphotransferase
MLEKIDLNKKVTPEDYDRKLSLYQLQLQHLGHVLYERGQCLIVVFEGWDAAGKGGAIKRAAQQLDSRGYEVYPISAPEGEDRKHHYLWRFWRRLKPSHEKQIQIFDRSWYGRVLVERVEGFCTETEWRKAYREINEFEHQLFAAGMVLVKFWLQISQDEQLNRFKERENNPFKSWKLTSEDWRNREKWSQYNQAVEDMLVKTSTIYAPWMVVEANDKYFSRIKILETLVNSTCNSLNVKLPDPLSMKAEKKRK